MMLACVGLELGCGGITSPSDGGAQVDAMEEPDASACYHLAILASWRSCARNEDCTVATTQISCCGTYLATGVNLASASVLTQADHDLESHCRQCRCAPSATEADDGTHAGSWPGPLPAVSCEVDGGAGICRSSYTGPNDAGGD